MINAVLGKIKSEELGTTMMHEHLVPRERIPEFINKERFVKPCTVEDIVIQLKQAKEYGLNSIVDCTPNCEYRDPEVLKDIAERAELNIVAATGFYKEPGVPGFVYDASVNELVDLMVKELTQGIENTGIKAGIIKVGTSKNKISRIEKKVLKAAAKAHLKTGVPITTHTTLGTKGLAQIEIFEEEGVETKKLVIGHSGLNNSYKYHELIAKHGASLGFDTIGKERFEYVRMESAGANRYEFEKEEYHVPDDLLIDRIKELVKNDFSGNIVLSSDLTRSESYINPETFGRFGYSYLLHRFVPLLKKNEISKREVNRMLIDNPCSIFD